MKPAAFNYHRPSSLVEVLSLLAEFGAGAKLLAGGQSLTPMLNMRLASPAHLVDVNDLTEFSCIRDAGDALEVGALARHHQVAQSPLVWQTCPLVALSAQTIGHYAIRQRGTLGGSLCHADPAAQLVLAAVTLDAQMTLVSRNGHREVSARDFFQAAMTTALAPDEMLLSVRWPKAKPDEAAALRLFSRRHGDFALVAVATTVALDGSRVSRLQLGVGGVAPVPQRLDAVTASFEGQIPDASWIEAVATAAASAITPEDDSRVPAAYRRELTHALTTRALCRTLEKLKR